MEGGALGTEEVKIKNRIPTGITVFAGCHELSIANLVWGCVEHWDFWESTLFVLLGGRLLIPGWSYRFKMGKEWVFSVVTFSVTSRMADGLLDLLDRQEFKRSPSYFAALSIVFFLSKRQVCEPYIYSMRESWRRTSSSTLLLLPSLQELATL